MLTTVMMKVEGVTKEVGEKGSMMMTTTMMMMMMMMESVTKEGRGGKKDQRVRIGLGGEGPSLRAADKKCKTCWRA